MARRRRPGTRQIEEAVPVYPGPTSRQELRRPLQPERLHLVRAEGRYADFRDPDRQIGDRANLVDLRRPVVDLPVIPVEWKPVDRPRIDAIEHALIAHVRDEVRIDR